MRLVWAILLGFYFTAHSSCSYKAPDVKANFIPSQEIRLHTISYPAETLSIIALWYTGDSKNWTILKIYNGQIKSPANMTIGQIVRIPSEIMQRFEPMPEQFVLDQIEKIKAYRKKNPLPKTVKGRDPVTLDQSSGFETEIIATQEELNNQQQAQDQLYENLIPSQE